MKKIIIIIIILLSSCSFEYDKAKTFKEDIIKNKVYQEVCVDGHIYYKGHYILALKVNDNGLPLKCEKIKGIKQ